MLTVYSYSITPGDYRVEERPIPEIGEGDVLVKILAVGICAGDAKCFAGAPYFWGKNCSGAAIIMINFSFISIITTCT